ncbi:hypothetical protein Tco_1454016 [Tanacetum coccineum]
MECGFLSQKGSRGGRGVKEKNKGVVAKHDVSPSVIDEPVVNGEGDSENARQTCANSASDGVVPISTPIPGKSSSYANVTGLFVFQFSSMDGLDLMLENG